MDDSLRNLMARIAKGLPVVVIGAAAPFVLAGCFGGGGCGDPMDQTIVIASPDADAGPGVSDAGPVDCWTLCQNTPERPDGVGVISCGEVLTGIECNYGIQCIGGRRPELAYSATASASEGEPRRRWLMQLAVAELASVPAFEELAEALDRHGAPLALVERARQSAEDEVRHARLAFALATREGEPLQLRVEAPRRRTSSLRELAIHNAKEGCVREAYAALEAMWQAQHADDEETRAAFATIARDEAGHAALSLDIDRWARATLEAEDARVLDEARVEAMSELHREISDRDLPRGLGLPSAPEALVLARMVA